MRVKILGITGVLLAVIISASAQDFYQIQNRWKPNEYIHVEQPNPAIGPIQPGWLSAQWVLEPIAGTGYYQIKNRWRNEFLHIQNNRLECGAIQPGWWSAQWALEPVAGTSSVRIRNHWKPEIALHNQQGYLEAGPIDLGWWSAQWQTIKAGGGETAPAQQSITTSAAAVTTVSERNGENPRAFSPEHNGSIEQASVRYTDQISFSARKPISIGTKIYFFPQEVIANIEGLSFDPKNPPIGGQEYTVIQINPQLKLDRPMPMMRNRNNDSFGFVIEVY